MALACAALALLGLLAHPSPAAAQTVVWTATFTPADLGFSVLGCSAAVDSKHCSSASILSEDSFTHDSTDYSVTLLFLRDTGRFEFTVDTDITTATATAALTLEVGSTSLVLADADVKTARNRGWDNSGVSLTAGTAVTVKLTELDETPPTLISATVSGPGGSIALAFSEDLQSANLPLAAAFTVTVGGTAVTVSAVAAGTTPDGLQISVSTLIAQGQAVVVAYADPTGGDDAKAIQDTVGNDTPDFTTGSGGVPAVTNNSALPNEVLASWSLKPAAVAVGTRFRLLFLSSTKRDALSSDIAVYNTFVQDRAAAGHADIRAYSAGFGAIGCTGAVDARDNTSTIGTGVPIYWLDGTKVADDYADFYDGSWDDEVNDKNESGTDAHDTSQAANYPFTGCKNDGTEEFAGATDPRGLGATTGFVRTGRLNSSGTLQDPIDGNDTARTTDTRPMYGLSAVFEVADAPSLTSAVVNETGQLIQLEFSKYLHASNLPPATAFTVTAGGDAVQVFAVAAGVTPDVLQISVSPPIGPGQAVVLVYDDPTTGDDANAIQDAAGRDTPDFTTGSDGVPAVNNNSTAGTTVPATWSLKPAAVAVGAKFRLLFLSSTRRNASSTDIATYNTFIQNLAAAGHVDIRAFSAGFRAVGCTSAVDARDNTSTTYTTSDKGVPIYWLNGTKAADDYEDFYDGDWDDEANDKNASGNDGPDTSQFNNYPWTGCLDNGTGEAEGELGTSVVQNGRPNSSASGHGPLNSGSGGTQTFTHPMYGLSEVFQAATLVDATPPMLASAAVAADGNSITVTFDENVDQTNLPAAAAFSVEAGGAPVTVSGVSAGTDADQLVLALAAPGIVVGQTVTLGYTDPTGGDDTNAVQDTAGNDAASFSGFSVTNNSTVADTIPPSLVSARVTTSGTFIQLVLSERYALPTNVGEWPQFANTLAGHFSVTADGNAATVTQTAGNLVLNPTMTLNVSPPIRQGQAVVVTYTDPTAGDDAVAIEDAAGNETATFTTGRDGVPPVTNDSTVAPVPTSAAVAADGNSITVTFDESVDQTNLPAAGTFSVAADGAPVTVSGVSAGTAAQLVLALAAPGIAVGQVVTLGYTDPTAGDDTNAVQDTAGNDAASFSGFSVTNNSTVDTTPPSLLSATVTTSGIFIQLVLSETYALPTNSGEWPQFANTLAGHFSVTADGNAATVTQTAGNLVLNPTMTLNVSPPIRQGQSVVVTYTDPTAGDDAVAIEDAAGNETGTFTTGRDGVPAVTNNSTVATEVPNNWSLKPTGLAAGDQFRLLFLSSTKRNATATDIATYNTFIQNLAAAGHTDIRDYSAGFRAVGCTAATDARDNTATTYTGTAKGVPIYWLNGTKAADEYEDFYDGDWDDEANDKNASGNDGPDTSQVSNSPLTGCTHEGTEKFTVLDLSQALGSTVFNPAVGRPNSSTTGNGPLSSTSSATPLAARPMYGLSALFQVAAPVDTTAPTLTRAAVNESGLFIELEFSENVDQSNLPPVAAFEVTAGGSPVTFGVGPVRGSLKSLRMVVSSTTIRQDQAVVVTYTDPSGSNDANAIQDTAGNDALSFITGSGGVPPVTNLSTVTGTTAPGAPTGLMATASGSARIDLSWTAPGSDGGSAITGYRIEWSADGSTPWTELVANTANPNTTHADTGLAASTTRHYRVSAINANGASAPSNVDDATTDAGGVNNPPTFSANTAARSVAENTAAGQNVGAALTATDDDGHTLTYTLEGADAASFDILSTSGQILTKAGVTYNHEAKSTYTVIVKADDGNGGTDTVTVTITVTDVTEPPGRPAPPSVSGTGGSTTSLDVTWTAPTNTGPAITSYDLQYREGTSGSFTAGPQNETGTSAAIASLMASTSHQVQVRATNAEGDGAWSGSGTGRTGASVPGAPTSLSAIASGSTQIDLSWTAPGSDGGSSITGYKIEISSDGGANWSVHVATTGNPATTYSHIGLAAGTTRHYRVSAINANGAGAPSNTDNATTTVQTTVRFEAAAYTATEGGSDATVAVVLSAAPSAPVTIPLTKAHVGGAAATDYSSVPANVTFPTGQTRQTFTLRATDDSQAEGDERVRFGFGSLPSGYASGPPRTATVTLIDDDAGLILSFGTERHHTVKVRESETVWHRFTLTLRTHRYAPPDGNPLQAFTIPLEVTHRNGAGPEDYTPIPASVTFEVGQSTTFFRMRALPDRKKETGESLRVDFGLLPAGLSKSTWGPYETIEFLDEYLPDLTVRFGAEAYTAREGGAAARVSIHLSEPVDVEPLDVRLQVSYGGGATEDDHGPIPESVRFAVGEQTKTIIVTATDDTDDDDGESVSLSFVNAPNDRLITGNGPSTATVALEDNDGPAAVEVSFEAATYTATEGGADATVSVQLDKAPGRPVTVPLTKAHAGGATTADYSAIPANVAFGPNETSKTFLVTATDDPESDGGESVRIGFGALPDGVLAGRPASAVVTLADGTEQTFLVSFGTNPTFHVQAREGNVGKRFVVYLSNDRWGSAGNAEPRRPVTIPLVVTYRGGATEADHTPIPASVTFEVGSGRAGFNMRAIPDGQAETGESLRIDFGELPPGVTKGRWGYETIEFVDEEPVSLWVSGPLLTMRYPGALDGGSTPSGGDFVVVAGAPGGEAVVPVTSVSVDGEAVLLGLARPVAADETVTLTYLTGAMHPIRDAQGLAAPLADEPVRNETGASGLLAQAGPAGGTAIRTALAGVPEAAQMGAGTERLDLSSQGLTDVSALAGLAGVFELNLADNAIADLSPLAGLTGLEVLNLSGNRVADIATLAGLTELERLNLSDNRIEALSPLAGLSGLKVLDLSGNRIEALSPLAGLTGLERLNLSGNGIGELLPLAGLGGLQVLLLDGNRVADVLGLSPLAGLENLGLSGNRIADIGLLGQLRGLRRLDLSGNAVEDISALGEVSGLLWLRLPGNPVSDIAPLGRLEQLRWLWLDPATAPGMEAWAVPPGRGAAPLWIERVPAQ